MNITREEFKTKLSEEQQRRKHLAEKNSLHAREELLSYAKKKRAKALRRLKK